MIITINTNVEDFDELYNLIDLRKLYKVNKFKTTGYTNFDKKTKTLTEEYIREVKNGYEICLMVLKDYKND